MTAQPLDDVFTRFRKVLIGATLISAAIPYSVLVWSVTHEHSFFVALLVAPFTIVSIVFFQPAVCLGAAAWFASRSKVLSVLLSGFAGILLASACLLGVVTLHQEENIFAQPLGEMLPPLAVLAAVAGGVGYLLWRTTRAAIALRKANG